MELGTGNYQTVINNVLRTYIEGKQAGPELEATLRHVIREELRGPAGKVGNGGPAAKAVH